MTADDQRYDGTEALMAAITGEQPPDGADAAFLAEHRRAEADLALLREQLGIIGDALAEEQPRSQRTAAAVRPSRNWRPVRRFAFAGLAVTAVAGVLSGMIWLLGQAGGEGSDTMSGGSSDSGAKPGANAEARSPFDSPGYLACARLVAEGRVTEVEQVPGAAGHERITLHVTRSYKPEKSEPEVTLVIDEGNVDKALRKGDQVLVAVPRRSAVPDQVVVGEQDIAHERAGITRAVSESTGIRCE